MPPSISSLSTNCSGLSKSIDTNKGDLCYLHLFQENVVGTMPMNEQKKENMEEASSAVVKKRLGARAGRASVHGLQWASVRLWRLSMLACFTYPLFYYAFRPLPPFATTSSVALQVPSLRLASPSASPTVFFIQSNSTQVRMRAWLFGSMHLECAGIIGKQIQAIIFPLLLTSLLYLGPLTMVALEVYEDWQEDYLERFNSGGSQCSEDGSWRLFNTMKLLFSDVLAWRNFVMAPLTEEVVFRACMIPILLCAGFQPVAIIFLCPLFFGLAHVNHFWELVHHQNLDKKRAFLIVGAQLGYTTIFGWYACFLLIRTGNILAPLAAHVFCNIMGFPDLPGVFQRGGLIFMFLVGVFGFYFMLMPLTHPLLYNNMSSVCYCWLGHCKWR
ncbi:hypothetical protein GOP47_0019929 [Adiantum capillus-veneris]|uniref:intramembrane prenyl-peptidase Rce1 n=1 Tax=Adiantum capillus-veneris TaxID=13818 RepID=A0A9D4UDE6_ADICA|nr:hypothetical protein GOP47_0019929 [Adiantum capillus-veneris]